MMNRTLPLLGLFLLFFAFSACEKDEVDTKTQLSEAVKSHAKIVLLSYEDSYNTAVTLQQKINAFVQNPTATGLEECRTAWKAARIPYGQTEAYRFYGGPIDSEDGPEGLINAWPLDENFIDYVQGNATAGLINNPSQYPTINKQALADLNESISETSIFTGYHAIEFLLWGQDGNANGAGNRPYTDYLTTGGTAQNQARRGQYLKAVAELLVDNLNEVVVAWKANSTYVTEFTKASNQDSTLTKIFTGIGKLAKGELSDERIFVAVDSKDQENEHSCFSDNTHIDIQMNFKGIQNVYFGTYTSTTGTKLSGTNLAEIAKKVNATKADALEATFKDAETKIKAIPVPFDQAIVNSPEKVLPAVEALRKLGDQLSDVALSLGVKL